MASSINIVVKPTAGGAKFTVEALVSDSVAELKDKVAQHCSIAAGEQRLIYKGQILKDERTVESYGLESEHVIHLVKGRPAGTTGSVSNGPAAAQTLAGATGAVPGLPAGLGGANPAGGLAAMLGGAGGAGMEQQMASLMESPVMQNMLNNPELLRTVFQANPQIQQMMNANPEIASILNDPQVLRDSLRMAANPALMREQMRTTDRALSNIESHPEGFNALRRMYETVQEPLTNAASSGNAAPADAAANPFAALFQQPAAAAAAVANASPPASGAPNAAPLPNPWAPPASAAQGGANPAAGLPGMGGLPGLGGGMDMNSMAQMMQNPAMQQMMQQMMSSPGMMQAVVNSNPQLRAMTEANPQLRSMLNNPDVMRQMMDPQNLQAMAQLQQAMPGGAGLFGGLPAGAGGAAGADPAALLNLLVGGAFGGSAAPPPVANPEEAYAVQIQQLVDMGFYDRELNCRALQATGGNVNAAVERLLNS